MDQLKVYLALLKKHHFWVLSVVVLIVGAAGWFIASTALSNTYKTERAKIDNEFSELQKVTGLAEHPNEKWKEGMDGLTNQLATRVESAWRLSYEEQQQKVLLWPKELGAPFAKTMASLSATEEIPLTMRNRYLNYVENEFPKLLQIADARPYFVTDQRFDEKGQPVRPGAPRPQAPRGGKRGEAVKPNVPEVLEDPDHDYKVTWDTKNQTAIHQELTFASTPTSPQVRFTQENLWVYRSLLNLIANVNDKATGHHNARIKEIRDLLIGNLAGEEFKKGIAGTHIIKSANAPTVGVAPVLTNPDGDAIPPPTAAAAPVAVQVFGPDGLPLATPDAGRYVDAKGAPLVPGTNVADSEFKRMPVYLKLFMDQREISHLLVQCANSPLPVEVRQLRINPKGTQINSQAVGKQPGEQDQNPYDLVVELHGIIYIFNPPNRTKLGLNPAVATDAADPAAPPAPFDAVPVDAAPVDAAPIEPAADAPPADAAADPPAGIPANDAAAAKGE